MAITEADWKAANGRIKSQSEPVRQVHETLLRQAAVESSLLVGSQEWDKYLQKLQVELDTAEGELKMLHEKLTTPLSSEQLNLIYISINVFAERIKVLKHCMLLPKEIIQHAADLGLITRPHE